jgi:hypothetical protein
MAGEPTPEQIGRSHALQRLAECADTLATAREEQTAADPDDAAFLAAYAATCRSIADKLRKAPGARL